MADNGGRNHGLVALVVVLAVVAGVLAYMWWQEEESNEFEIEIGSAGTDAAVERSGTLAAAPPSGVVLRRS